MKLTTGILFLGMLAGTAWGQNPDVIDNTRSTLNALQRKHTNDENAVLANSPGSAATSASPSGSQPVAAKVAARPVAKKAAAKHSSAKAVASKKSEPKQRIAVEDQKKPKEAKADAPKQINLAGRRDPFISPVVNRSMIGSGCSVGKRCLAIDQINLKGVVKSDGGMIAVVVNSLDKAYFLHENDPVFNGYVVKITGDSIVFKETVQDRMGKPFTREVTKKITTSAV